MLEISEISQALEKIASRRHNVGAFHLTETHSSFIPPQQQNVTKCYFLLTELPIHKNVTHAILLSKEPNSVQVNQFDIINLSKEMYEGTKPMIGVELNSLYKAINKQHNTNVNFLL